MRTVLNLELPWLSILQQLVDVEDDGRINYTKFLERYRIAMRDSDLAWMESILERACEKLFTVCHSLEDAFAHFDVDKSGVIEFEELERGLTKMDIGLSRSQTYELMTAIDSDRDGRIQFAEFAERFRLIFSRVKDQAVSSGSGAGVEMDEWTRKALTKLGTSLFKGGFGTNAPAVFAKIDTDGDGLLSEIEFLGALKSLNLGFSDDEGKKLLAVVDVNNSGSINYLEFVQAFKVAESSNLSSHVPTYSSSNNVSSSGKQLRRSSSDPGASKAILDAVAQERAKLSPSSTGGSSSSSSSSHHPTVISAPAPASAGESRNWQRGVIEQIIGTLYEYRVELAAAFRMFDLDGNGVISAEEFRQGLQALTGLTGSPITDMQADEMLKVLDENGDGQINFEEFCSAFRIVDTRSVSK